MAGERYVIGGLSRLTVRVARLLTARGAEVVVAVADDDGALMRLLGPRVRTVASDDCERALQEAGVGGATCLLALADDDLDNLRTATVGAVLAPGVPLVVRSFDAVLDDELERSGIVRRAFSVSDLSAPAFVAAALGDEVVETLRLGDDEVLLCRITVRPGSPLESLRAGRLEQEFGCCVLAGDDADGTRLIGGPLLEVLKLVLRNSPTVPTPGGRRRRRSAPRRPFRGATLLPAAAIAFIAILVLATVVFAAERELGIADALYFAFTTAWGNAGLVFAPAWLKVFGVFVMLSVGGLVGVLFSHLAAVATAERLEGRMGRRAGRRSGHVVVAGLGTIGYRVERLLHQVGLDATAIERSSETRFVEAVREHTPVLTGDARLPENLERAGIARASCLLAVTDEDLVNITACLHARRANPRIRTVARVFDDTLSGRIGPTLKLDSVVSASRVAAGAFVAAATDDWARRSFTVGEEPFLALRIDCRRVIEGDEIERWSSEGVRVLAFRRGTGAVEPASQLGRGLATGDSAIVAGPEAAVVAIV